MSNKSLFKNAAGSKKEKYTGLKKGDFGVQKRSGQKKEVSVSKKGGAPRKIYKRRASKCVIRGIKSNKIKVTTKTPELFLPEI